MLAQRHALLLPTDNSDGPMVNRSAIQERSDLLQMAFVEFCHLCRQSHARLRYCPAQSMWAEGEFLEDEADLRLRISVRSASLSLANLSRR